MSINLLSRLRIKLSEFADETLFQCFKEDIIFFKLQFEGTNYILTPQVDLIKNYKSCLLLKKYMGDTLEIIYQEMAYIDYLLITHIKEMRDKKGYTQLQLSQKMKLSDGFVSKVETLTERAKYNIRHLPLLAKALDCNIEDLLPKDEYKFDLVILTIHRRPKRNQDGIISKKKESKVVHIEPAS